MGYPLGDSQLMLLEQLTYLNGDVAGAAEVKLLDSPTTVKEMLGVFNEERLQTLKGKDVGYETGEKWAEIISAIQNDPDLLNLNCVKRDMDQQNGVYAICYTDSDNNAYVTFEGTDGGKEWEDNARGFSTSDTPCQQKALDFIESLEYDNITVVGHSKGGNKAQYVAITSDKVSRCVSMDGQGFSPEFIEQYAAEIRMRSGNIKNYSLETDYVHILMYPVPGAEQIYIKSELENPGARNHLPSALLHFDREADAEGRSYWAYRTGDVTKENPAMTYLHEFTCFALSTMPISQREDMGIFIGGILGISFGEEYYVVEVNEKKYHKDELIKYLADNQEDAALLIAYIMKYVETYNLTFEEVMALLDAFGLREALDELISGIAEYCVINPAIASVLGLAGLEGAYLLKKLYDELRDGKNDPIIETLLDWVNGWLNEKLGVEIDAKKLWQDIEKNYCTIVVPNPATANANAGLSASRVFDYSNACHELLMTTIAGVEGCTSISVSGWSAYSSEEWYGSLGIVTAMKGINRYFNHLSEINANCRGQIERIFGDVRRIDADKAQIVLTGLDTINNATRVLSMMASQIQPIAN